MAALLTPYEASTLVKDLKAAVKIPVQLHTHYTSGLASMCIMKAAEAGVDGVDTAMSPLANGTSHAPTESVVAAFQGTEYDTGLDLVKLNEIREYFMGLRKKYIDSGLLDPSMLASNTKALLYQVPGGMLSNLLSQLKQAGKADQLEEVLKEVPRVRKDSGFPPLVTPTSQIVGTQAVFNVITGERYKTVTKEFKGLVKGEYGKTPVDIDPQFQKQILKDEKPITCRPADLLEPEFETMKKEAAEWTEQEEDVLTYAMFPKVAPNFFKARRDKKYGVDSNHSDAENKVHPV
jgi:oxaloacetate decarboxylase alpha subunit